MKIIWNNSDLNQLIEFIFNWFIFNSIRKATYLSSACHMPIEMFNTT